MLQMQDRCETIDLSQNSLVDGEDQLVGIRGAVLGRSLFRASESISLLPRMAAGFRLAVVVVVIPSRNYSLSIQVDRSRKPCYIARNFPKCSPSFSDCTPWLSECLGLCESASHGPFRNISLVMCLKRLVDVTW